MSSIPSRRRNRTLLMLLVNLAVLIAAGGLVFAGTVAIRHYTAAKNAASSLKRLSLPETPTALLGATDSSGTLTMLAVLVLPPGSPVGGSIVSVPVNADSTSGVGAERISLQESYSTGGVDGLRSAAESALGISFDQATVIDAGALSALLKPLGPVEVTLPADVLGDKNGGTTVVLPKGASSLSADALAKVLTTRSSTEREILRRPNIEAVWAAVAAAVGKGKTTPSAGLASVGDVVSHLFAGPLKFRGLSAAAFPQSLNPTDLDVENLDRAEVTVVFASISPSAMSTPRPGLVYRIEADPGSSAKVQELVAALLYSGNNVSSIDFNTTPPATTTMYVVDPLNVTQAKEVGAIIGNVTYAQPKTRIDGIDVVIALGTDFLTSHNPVVTSATTTVP